MALNPSNLGNGCEQHEIFNHPCRRGKKLCQYDYRHTDGELFSCVAATLADARAKRDAWVSGR
ncbi:DUF3873 family protein [Desulfovibrio desulfuricans]|uniref:DUF3873 family protein n=1 Tax=Desulfovibrio desulfuricans TaxID=876 RepID=UPI0039845AA8